MLPNQPTDDFPYRVETQIGSGAMGLVYRAHEPALDRPVAIKVLRLGPLEQRSPSERDELHRRFLQEGRAAARLSHPAVTTVYRVGEVAVPSERLIGRAFDEDVPLSMPYLAMEWLDGHTLATRMQTRSRLPVGEAVHLVLQLLDALRIAHRAGVVHRDLKPANLMILAEGRLKVTDFGIASLEERSLVETQEGIILATPKFAAPEQLRGESVDLRADLHAVGVLLYHMVTGAMPYEGTTFMALANAILAEPPIAPRRYAPGLPDALVDVIERALAKNPSERYADAAAMAQSLLPLAPGAQAELLSLSLSASPVPVGAAAPITVSPTPAADDFDDVAEQTLPMPSVRSVTTVADLPAHPAQRVATVVRDWPASTLPEQSIDALIDRLVDRPLHAPAFTGAVQIGAVHLLVSDGVLCGLCDAERGETGDAVAVRLPETAAPVLRPHPDGADAAPVVRLLAALLMPEPGWTDEIHTRVVNAPAYVQQLQADGFTGIVRVERADGSDALALYVAGRNRLQMVSTGWRDVQVDRSWSHWLDSVDGRIRTLVAPCLPSMLWYRRAYRDRLIHVMVQDRDTPTDASPSLLQRLQGRTGSQPIRLTLRPGRGADRFDACSDPNRDPIYAVLSWMVAELGPFFAERDREGRWKYLAGWLPLARRALLHHDLPQPEGGARDHFDLVTFDEADKVLHLVERVPVGSVEAFNDFVARVERAKEARFKTGDVGGAVLVAPRFDDAAWAAYQDRLQTASRGLLGLEEAYTGYQGFIRMGARRGFHLLLVEVGADGRFTPRLPS